MKKKYRLVLEVEAEHPSTDERIADKEMQEYIVFQLGARWRMDCANQTEDYEITDIEIEEI